MSYTWEEVMLGIDVRDEARREEQEHQDILDKQQAEANAASGWSLGLSILGIALGLGPVGYAAGKILGRYGADWGWFEGITGDDYSDWEDMEVSEGKFYKDQSRKVNEILDIAAKDQTSMQALSTLTDLATMYVQAGGLQEGPTDFTTFGSGDAEWSLWGRGDAPIDTSGMTSMELDDFYKSHPDITKMDFKTGIMPGSANYVPPLFSGGLKPAIGRVQGAATSGQAIKSTLGQYYDESKEI